MNIKKKGKASNSKQRINNEFSQKKKTFKKMKINFFLIEKQEKNLITYANLNNQLFK